MIEKLKQNMVAVGAIFSTIVTIAGGTILMDSRYAHAIEIEQKFTQQNSQIKLLRVDTARRHYDSKVEALQEKKIQLMLKPVKTDADKSMIKFYDDQVIQINKKADIEVREITEGTR